MSILSRHLLRRVLVGIGLVALAVTSVLTLVDLIDEARRVQPGAYSFADALWVIALTTPQRLYEVLPVSVFIGSLLGLGQLVADSEMTALRAAGIGGWWLARRLLGVGLALALATILIGELLAPAGVEAAWDLRRQSQVLSAADRGQGLWLRQGDRYLHVLRGGRRDRLEEVLVYRLDEDGGLQHSLHAKGARFADGRWVLSEVRESTIHPDGSVTRARHASRADVELPAADVLAATLIPADEIPLMRLQRYLSHFSDEELDLRFHRFAWWQRLTTPLSCVVVLLLTLSFTFTQSRGGGLGHRIFIGVVSGIGIYLFNRVGGHAGMLAGLPPWLAAFLPLAALFLLGYVALSRRWLTRRRPGGWRSSGRASTAGPR